MERALLVHSGAEGAFLFCSCYSSCGCCWFTCLLLAAGVADRLCYWHTNTTLSQRPVSLPVPLLAESVGERKAEKAWAEEAGEEEKYHRYMQGYLWVT